MENVRIESVTRQIFRDWKIKMFKEEYRIELLKQPKNQDLINSIKSKLFHYY